MILLRRITGATLIILAALSLLISMFFTVQVWRIRLPVTNSISSALDVTTSTLTTTNQALTVAVSALETASSTVSSLVSMLESLSATVEGNQPMIGSLANLMETVLPTTVDSLQKSFSVAQDSARVIDGVLRGVTSIPFFPGEPYDPEVPLHELLAEVSKSMDDLPNTFEQMQKSLESTGGNLTTFNSQLSQLTTSVAEINRSLTETKLVLDQYQKIITGTLESIEKLKVNLPTLVNAAAAFITFVLIWLAVAQLGVLVQGVNMVKSNPAAEEKAPAPPAELVEPPDESAE